MKTSKNLSKIFILTLIIFVSSCSNKHKNISKTTGWKINTNENGGFEAELNYEQETPSGMVFIEGGSFIMGQTGEDALISERSDVIYKASEKLKLRLNGK